MLAHRLVRSWPLPGAPARERLAYDELLAGQVALALGFADQAHFTKAFGRYSAMTPGQFRDIKF